MAELWLAGSWSGLFQAVGFGILLNAAIAVTLVWRELASPELRFAAWTALGTAWLMGAWSAWRSVLRPREPDGDLFSRALSEYLQGNWFAAEAVLERLMKACPRDIEAQLLLATLFRRTGRLNEAREMLDKLARSQGAENWEPEIERERMLLDRTPSAGQREAAGAAVAAAPAGDVIAAHNEPTNTSRAA